LKLYSPFQPDWSKRNNPAETNGLSPQPNVESWQHGELAGGLYGIAMGGAFFGESMFFFRPDASKVAFAWLVAHLKRQGYLLLDAQIMNPHLERLGAIEIPHDDYMAHLELALTKKISFL
jgi:leucyl/phenylalanyl-tRNA---protein transferase